MDWGKGVVYERSRGRAVEHVERRARLTFRHDKEAKRE